MSTLVVVVVKLFSNFSCHSQGIKIFPVAAKKLDAVLRKISFGRIFMPPPHFKANFLFRHFAADADVDAAMSNTCEVIIPLCCWREKCAPATNPSALLMPSYV